MANPQLLPQEEIVKLPVKRIKLNSGGDMIPVYCDEENGIVYVKKEDGEFGWAAVNFNNSEPAGSKSETGDGEKRSDSNDGKGAAKSNRERKSLFGKPKEDRSEESQDGPASDKKSRFIIGGLMLGVVLLLLLYSSGLLSGKGKSPSSASSTPSPGGTEEINLAEKAAAESYNVLVVKRNLFRGNRITENDLAFCEISKAEFASCGGAYTADCASAVIGLEATRFLPFGSILTFDSCSFQTDYSESPWSKLTKGQEYLDVPYSISVENLCDWIPGEIVSLSLDVDTTKSQRSDSNTDEIDGMEHSSAVSASTTTDSFKFSSIQIADLLNANGESIFLHYANLYSVPIGFIPSIMREEYDEKSIQDFIPCYIRFVVTSDQRKAIGTLSEDTVSVKLKHLDDPDTYSLPVDNYQSLTKYIADAVEKRYTEIEEAKKEAEK